jgi:hypothetical protein
MRDRWWWPHGPHGRVMILLAAAAALGAWWIVYSTEIARILDLWRNS